MKSKNCDNKVKNEISQKWNKQLKTPLVQNETSIKNKMSQTK